MYQDYYPYDIETLANYFSCVVERLSDGAKWYFEISPWRHDGYAMYMFFMQVGQSGGVGVGYNNEAFDYPVIHEIMLRQGNMTPTAIYNYAQRVIRDINRGQKWQHNIWDNEKFFLQIDLMKVHHFDNTAKMTSLKLLEFNMRLDNIQEMPHHHSKQLNLREAAETLAYNDNDVFATKTFLKFTIPMLEPRYELSQKFGRNFVNFNDTKIGEQIVVETLKKNGIFLRKGDKTLRDKINVGDILFPYLEFNRREFQVVHEFFKSAVIDAAEIKGYFGSRDKTKSKCKQFITLDYAMMMDPNDVTVMCGTKTTSLTKYLEKPESYPNAKFRPTNIHTVVDGFRFDFGAGGIHGSLHNTIVKTTRDRKVRDSDVASFYPNIGIQNEVYPEHIGPAWCGVMTWLYEERLRVGKKTSLGNGYKLALNGSYGKSNDEHSVLCDPQYTMTITINGQLLLCMLAEALMDSVPDFQMIQINTDGLTYSYPPEYEYVVEDVCKWWESLTKLELEHVDYDKMCIRDVNSYLAVTKPFKDKEGKLVPPKVKRIGAYAYVRAEEDISTRELPWHKNHSAIVVAKAAEAALVRNENIERFIRNHVKVDPYDFYLRTKVPRSGQVYLETSEGRTQVQNVSRYYVSNSGGQLVKEMVPTEKQQQDWLDKPHWRHIVSGVVKQSKSQPSGKWVQVEPPSQQRPPTRTRYHGSYLVTVANKLDDGPDISDVNIDFYVAETRKLVDELVTKSPRD